MTPHEPQAEPMIIGRPTESRSFRQQGVATLDASGSMTESAAGTARQTKAAAAGTALSELIGRLKVSARCQNFFMAEVDFHDRVAHAAPTRPVVDIDDFDSFDPTRFGTGGTAIACGLERAHQLALDFLNDPAAAELPSSSVILLLTDGEDFQPERTIALADKIREDPRITIAAAFFATKGRTSNGADHLKRICSDPSRFYKTVYDGETLRKFFEASMTAATQITLGPGA